MSTQPGFQQQQLLAGLSVQEGIGQQQVMIAQHSAAGANMVLAQQALWTAEFVLAWGSQVAADGVASRSLAVPLHRNALVRRFDVRVSAARASAVLLGNAAQVREQSSAQGRRTVVADFGAMVTVASVGVLNPGMIVGTGLAIHRIVAWNGISFPTQSYQALFTATGSGGTHEATFGETRTERLLIEVSGSANVAAVASGLWVELPDPPSDLALRIDNGPPVWTSPGPVRPNQGGWSAEGRQTVDLGPALAALTGDPDDHSPVTFTLTLTSRTPGRLELSEAPGGRDLRHLARIRPGGSDAAEVAFEAEGVQRLALPLPAWTASVERVAFTATASLGPERVVPPVGPPLATSLGTAAAAHPGGVAELVLDADRAACVRLPALPGMAEAASLRLPLRAGPAGAEVRVVLLAAREDGGPGEPMEGAVSRPVTLDPPGPAAAPGGGWCTFEFPAPLALAAGAPLPWAAVQVARGEAAWPLGLAAGAEIKRGPPTGPWQDLPKWVRDLTGVGGRLRVVGHAAKESPLAPLVVQVQGAASLPAFDADPRAVRVTPTPRGAPVEWTASPALAPRAVGGAKSLELVVTSHVAGTVTLRDVVVTATRSPT